MTTYNFEISVIQVTEVENIFRDKGLDFDRPYSNVFSLYCEDEVYVAIYLLASEGIEYELETEQGDK